MKSISYLDMVHELLNETDFQNFQKTYELPIKKSVKLISKRWIDSKDLSEIIKSTISEERDLSEPAFSFQWKKYTDVLFATRKQWLKSDSLWNHFLHQAWLIYVQEMAASLSVQMLWIEPWDKVLDMCAAPWWKSIQIADKLDDWFLISNEPDSWRKKALESNIYRCWKYNVWIIQQDGCEIWKLLPEFFDKVLVDAPCSGEWMQYKSWKKVWQRDEKKSQKLSQLQTQLLISWLESLKIWWELVYSTCTTNPLENECVISVVLEKYWDSIELLPVPLDEKSDWISTWRETEILNPEYAKKVARLWPHVQWTGWFFIAKFRKVCTISSWQWRKLCSLWGELPKVEGLSRFELNEKTMDSNIFSQLSSRWIQSNNKIWFFADKFTINAAPKSLIDSQIQTVIPNIKIWLPIFKIVKDSKKQEEKLIPLVWISQVFWNIVTENVLDISDFQLKAIMERGDLHDARLADYEWKFILLRRNGIWIWLVSVQKWIWKNKCF